ncbi:oligosaccharide flippase family protein [Rhodobacteraceae bacterium 2376]|uniref:Oligosaccharide flippase family protein n=2 Tax=Rhabdonatronobacter sediminivivens TaxID=2743469 RepID=A0A7Z0KYT7_9RHOB|nr:oligosaccharide flippase family protein [Rhabdonatronobacter sediminivivens]
MQALWWNLTGTGLWARVMRGSAFTIMGYGVSMALRLGSNLILARLLFPEAFGLALLLSLLMVGLQMFSDVGITPSILRSPRGDDPDFLNTAWTVQVLRGGVLWLAACALAWPMAQFYNAPELVQMAPVMSLALIISGFNPTRIDTAGRHLLLGRVTALDLVAQTIGLGAMVVLAWITGSIWALVFGNLVLAASKLGLCWAFLPGPPNRFRWERAAVGELFSFGKWIFLSTIAGFLYLHADKAVLGRYLSTELLGIYNIGHALASLPLLLATQLAHRMMIPIYRERPPAESRESYMELRRMRLGLTGAALALSLALALWGGVLVDLLYDDRYALSGSIVVVVAIVLMVQLIPLTYDQAALAAGDSGRFFAMVALRAIIQIAAFVIGVELFGLAGALAGQAVGLALSYLVVVVLIRRYGVWDPLHDALAWVLTLAIAALALTLNRDLLAALISA